MVNFLNEQQMLMEVKAMKVRPGPRLRESDPAKVAEIAESMQRIGQLHPIIVESDIEKMQYWIVAGRNRWEAAKSLNMYSVNVVLMHQLTDEQRKLIEIDENLARSELSASEVGLHIKARAALFVEDKRGGDFKSEEAKNLFRQNGEIDKKDPGKMSTADFVTNTAKSTGKSKRSIERALAVSKLPATELAAVKGTDLDKPGELEALAKRPKTERKPIIAAAVAKKAAGGTGDKVSAKPAATKLEKAIALIARAKAGKEYVSPEKLVEATRIEQAFITVTKAAAEDDAPEEIKALPAKVIADEITVHAAVRTVECAKAMAYFVSEQHEWEGLCGNMRSHIKRLSKEEFAAFKAEYGTLAGAFEPCVDNGYPTVKGLREPCSEDAI